jgi:RNA recognition motif-containing protein
MQVSERFVRQLEDFLKTELPASLTNDKFLSSIILEAFNSHSEFKDLKEYLAEQLLAFLEDDTTSFINKLQDFYHAKAKADTSGEESKAGKLVRTESNESQASPVVVIKRVPPKINKAHILTEYFATFGPVTRVDSNPSKGTAQIYFDSEASAEAALSSQDYVLGCKLISKESLQVEKPVNSKVAREIRFKKLEFAEERTVKVRRLLKLLNERKDQLTTEQYEALLSKIQQLRTTE